MPLQDDAAPAGAVSIAPALNLLFAASARNGREPSNKEIADRINELAGRRAISDETIRKLRKEGSPSPSIEKVQLLAELFQVPLDFFRTGKVQKEIMEELNAVQERAQQQRMRRKAEQEEQVNDRAQFLARKAAGLSPRGQEVVLGFINELERAQRKAPEKRGE